MGNALEKRQQIDAQLARIDEITEQRSLAQLEGLSKTRRAIELARTMNELRKLISGPILNEFMALAGSDLGFRTDKDKEANQYPPEVVRDVLIEGMLRGANPIGNEINIIAGKCYLTKAYFERMVRNLVSELRVIEGVPETAQSGRGALVPMTATWIYKGHRDELRCIKTDAEDNRIAVRVNAGMGIDAILGKAYRKLYARIYRRVTGSTWLEEAAGDEVVETTQVEPESEQKKEQPKTQSAAHNPHKLFAKVSEDLGRMDSISEINKYEHENAGKLHADAVGTFRELCEVRRQQIRDSRGERSNTQAPVPAPTA